jgi:hypothetical protein
MGGGWHRIKNEYTGKCVDIYNSDPAGYPDLQPFGCHNGDNQKWLVLASAGSWVQLISKVGYPGTLWCIDVYMIQQQDGADIEVHACNGQQNQRWQLGLAYARGTMPFAGNWGSGPGDGYTDARPPGHHIVECEPSGYLRYNYSQNSPYCNNPGTISHRGDWSVDVYAAAGTQVKFYGYGVGVVAGVTARVRAIVPTCDGDFQGQAGGNTVFVDIIGAQGQWYGWVSYGHLNDVPFGLEGDVIGLNQVLGKTEWWGFGDGVDGCYEVPYPNGVHTHIEMWNTYNFACYKDWYSGPVPINVTLGYGSQLGDIGRGNYYAERSPCA